MILTAVNINYNQFLIFDIHHDDDHDVSDVDDDCYDENDVDNHDSDCLKMMLKLLY